MKTLLLILMAAAALAMTSANAAETTPTSGVSEVTSAATNKLNILWTSQDKEVALKMVFMYALNAKKQGWWKEVQLIIWGPSARLTATDKEIQDYLKRLSEAGVVVVACRACADQYGVSKALEELGVEVKYMGRPLTDILKRGEKLMTL